MAETLLEYQTTVQAPDGAAYKARACGRPLPDGLWEGWLEFDPLDAGGETLRSGRETTQPNRTDAEYWASGLTPIYLEGAIRRAIDGPVHIPVARPRPPQFEEPAGATTAVSILDPFSVYEKGEALLRRQLGALSAWHLVNIIEDYRLSDEPSSVLSSRPASELIEIIVAGVSTFARK